MMQEAEVVMMQEAEVVKISGVDILIARGPDLEKVILAIIAVAGVARPAIKISDAGQDDFSYLDHSRWAVLYRYLAGDFEFKVDLGARDPFNPVTIARQLAQWLGSPVAIPDETTLAATAFIVFHPGGWTSDVALKDVEPDGLAF